MANFLEKYPVTFEATKLRTNEGLIQSPVVFFSSKVRRLNPRQDFGSKVRPPYGQMFPR